jgi:hypothetical protein
MNKKLFGLFIILFILVGTAAPARAAGLTSQQIQAILSLLSSFGADQSVINNVQTALGGTSSGGTQSSNNFTGDSSGCIYLTQALVVSSTDATTNGEVSKLQRFLIAAGVYPEVRVTGYYGQLTAQAVVRWQKAHGMNFVTTQSGVGPITRAKLQVACSNSPSTSLPTTCIDKTEVAPVITSLSAYSGSIGDTFEIRGCNFSGFEGDIFAIIENSQGMSASIGGPGSTSKLMKITLSSPLCQQNNFYSGLPCTSWLTLTPGTYKIYTNPWGKKSNEATFTIK